MKIGVKKELIHYCDKCGTVAVPEKDLPVSQGNLFVMARISSGDEFMAGLPAHDADMAAQLAEASAAGGSSASHSAFSASSSADRWATASTSAARKGSRSSKRSISSSATHSPRWLRA